VDVNSELAKFKRHYFGKFLLQSYSEKLRVINFDESTIDHFNCVSKTWSKIGKPNRSSNKPVTPRVSMVAAVDNYGNKYVSLHQRNSNRFSTLLILSQLFRILDKEDSNWKQHTILLIDGARYHTRIEVKAFFKLNGVRFAITSPNSP
jgi:hypothetical protein